MYRWTDRLASQKSKYLIYTTIQILLQENHFENKQNIFKSIKILGTSYQSKGEKMVHHVPDEKWER